MLAATMTKNRVLRNFGVVLRRLREEEDMSQEELSAECGFDRTYVSTLERGIRNPTLTTLTALAHALGVPLSAVFERVERGRR